MEQEAHRNRRLIEEAGKRFYDVFGAPSPLNPYTNAGKVLKLIQQGFQSTLG